MDFIRFVDRQLTRGAIDLAREAKELAAHFVVSGDMNAPAGTLGHVAFTSVPLPLHIPTPALPYLPWDTRQWAANGLNPELAARIELPAAAVFDATHAITTSPAVTGGGAAAPSAAPAPGAKGPSAASTAAPAPATASGGWWGSLFGGSATPTSAPAHAAAAHALAATAPTLEERSVAYKQWLKRLSGWLAAARITAEAAMSRSTAPDATSKGILLTSAYAANNAGLPATAARRAASGATAEAFSPVTARPAALQAGSKEPPLTHLTYDFCAALDYIFFTPRLTVPALPTDTAGGAGAVAGVSAAEVIVPYAPSLPATASEAFAAAGVSMVVQTVSPLPSKEEIYAGGEWGMPNSIYPSDHLPLTASFSFPV